MHMDVRPKQPSIKGPAETFTGVVWIDPIVVGVDPSRVRVNAVHFSPGARTAWHSHALGQTLFVTEGRGLVQSRGNAITEIGPGDIVFTSADEWHWHGATPENLMTHLSITEGVGDGPKRETDWGAHVTDDEYGAR
jgi:quercetin dioxygenase-like cupin family protein